MAAPGSYSFWPRPWPGLHLNAAGFITGEAVAAITGMISCYWRADVGAGAAGGLPGTSTAACPARSLDDPV